MKTKYHLESKGGPLCGIIDADMLVITAADITCKACLRVLQIKRPKYLVVIAPLKRACIEVAARSPEVAASEAQRRWKREWAKPHVISVQKVPNTKGNKDE